MKKFAFCVISFVVLLSFFSYKLTEIPRGLTIDEGAFGYNAVLLSKTFRDENNRAYPIFVLSIGGKDWRQPVTQYFITAFFKIFGPSIYNLKFTSAIVAALSVIAMFFLGRQFMGVLGGIFTAILLATTPIIMIHSHLALDNIYPTPFVIFWLALLFLFEKKKRLFYLSLSAIALGVSFYSYKAMRVFVPTWSVLTVLYLAYGFIKKRTKKSLLHVYKPILVFCLSILPFFAIIPWLEFKYAGAVLDNTSFKWESIYKFLYPYLSSFDFSFLFIKGDEFLYHSTGIHGMFLLASMPFFIFGLIAAYKSKDNFWRFLVLSFFLGPLLFGIVDSVHRASRMMALVPMYCLIASLGGVWLMKKKKKLLFTIFTVVLIVNFFDFLKYYWGNYAVDTKHIFYKTERVEAYKLLKNESEARDLTPIVEDQLSQESPVEAFQRSIYFLYPPGIWYGNEDKFPKNGILLSKTPNINSLRKLDTSANNYYLYVSSSE